MPNGPKIFQMTLQYCQWPYNIPTFSIPRPSQTNQTGIFGTKIYKLVTLSPTLKNGFAPDLLVVDHEPETVLSYLLLGTMNRNDLGPKL
jgi:hypothetical protein